MGVVNESSVRKNLMRQWPEFLRLPVVEHELKLKNSQSVVRVSIPPLRGLLICIPSFESVADIVVQDSDNKSILLECRDKASQQRIFALNGSFFGKPVFFWFPIIFPKFQCCIFCGW